MGLIAKLITRIKRSWLELPYLRYDYQYRIGTIVLPPFFSAAYYLTRPIFKNLAYRLVLASHRADFNVTAERLIKQEIKGIAAMVSIGGAPSATALAHITNRSLILQHPIKTGTVLRRKGLLLIKFSETFTWFLRHVDCESMLKQYHVVLEPSWAGYAIEEVLGWARFNQHKVYIQAAESKDFDFISNLQTNLVPIRCGSGDWVDYDVFSPSNASKVFDCIYVANYAPPKRIHIYLRAVSQVAAQDPEFRAVLVCAGWGSARQAVQKLIKHYDAERYLTLLEDLSHDALADVLGRSKVNVLLSLREGSNRSLFEAFFAGIPGLLLSENIGVNKLCFCSETGLKTSETSLADALRHFKIEHQSYHPREWALANIAPEITTRKITDLICRTESLPADYFDDVMIKVNRPEAEYKDPSLQQAQHLNDIGIKQFIYD